MILPDWDDTPWSSAAVRGHGNVSTLIHILAGHTRFVPAHKQSNGATFDLSHAKCPVEIVFIHTILGSAIQATCRLTPTEALFFPTPRGTSPSRAQPHTR